MNNDTCAHFENINFPCASLFADTFLLASNEIVIFEENDFEWVIAV